MPVSGGIGRMGPCQGRLRVKLRHGLVVGMFAFVAAGAAWADGSPFVGKWHWNGTLSRLPPGAPAPSGIVMEFARVEPGDLKWSVTTTDPQGHTDTETFDSPADGQFHPISGGASAAFRVGPSTINGTFKAPTGETDSLNCMLSPDRRRMTCNGTMAGPDGKPVNYVDVYDRS
jgi:hypothetical protein